MAANVYPLVKDAMQDFMALQLESLKGEIGALWGEMNGLRGEVKAEIHGLRGEVKAEIQGLPRSIDAVSLARRLST